MNNNSFTAKSFVAGLFIAIAQLLATSVKSTTKYTILPAIMFSIGLIAVLYFKANLFTGKVGFVDLEAKWADQIMWINDMFYMLVVNLLACLPLAAISVGASKPVFLKVAILPLFIQSMICGIFIYLAVKLWSTKYHILTTVICVAGFILCGGRHCIADWASYCLYINLNNTISSQVVGRIGLIAIGNACGAIIFRIFDIKGVLK